MATANCCIVSAFLTNVNRREDRSIQKYVDFGKQLLALDKIPKIVFLERAVYFAHFGEPATERVFVYRDMRYTCIDRDPNLTVVFFEQSDNYLCAYRESATNFSVETSYPAKDTLDYMFVQCHKTEWVAMAIACRGSAATSKYAWVDFGLRHMYRSDAAFEAAIYGLGEWMAAYSGAAIMAPSCWSPDYVYYQDIYRNIHWIFAGSAFIGRTEAMLEFARRMREKCVSILTVEKRLMWEVNVWYMVFLECRHLFQFYHADHNESILSLPV